MILKRADIESTIKTHGDSGYGVSGFWVKGFCKNILDTIDYYEGKLAEALKAKNDACERLRNIESRIYVLEGLNKDLKPQEVGTLLGLKIGAHIHAEILPALTTLVKERNEALSENRKAWEIIHGLKTELARLKPPEPKFRVGQVVHHDDKLASVTSRQLDGSSWVYEIKWYYGIGSHMSESSLRALTDEEK